jgi:hypothetical protein
MGVPRLTEMEKEQTLKALRRLEGLAQPIEATRSTLEGRWEAVERFRREVGARVWVFAAKRPMRSAPDAPSRSVLNDLSLRGV